MDIPGRRRQVMVLPDRFFDADATVRARLTGDVGPHGAYISECTQEQTP